MKPVFIAASPNTQADDVWLAVKLLLQPWSWFSTKSVTVFERKIALSLGASDAVAFDSARSAFYLLLKAYGIGAGDEVILPAFTCLVIANPVIWTGAAPVYIDCEATTFNIDLNDLRKKITSRTKAILIQHTFGAPVDIERVREIVGDKVKIIEDTAHCLGGSYKGHKLGTLGNAAVLTFGIEKVISSVRGGMAVTNDIEIAAKLREEQQFLPRFSRWHVYISLLNPVLWFLITPLYYLGIGKLTVGRIWVALAHKLGLMGNMIEDSEYKSVKPKWFPAQMPGALAELGTKQLDKLDRFNQHRRKIAQIYRQQLQRESVDGQGQNEVFLRYPVLVKDRPEVLRQSRSLHVVLGDWYRNVLFSPPQFWDNLKYKQGTAPLSEQVSTQIVNLPTAVNVSEDRAKQLAEFIKPHLK